MANQILGNILDAIGTAFNAKERGWSEQIANAPTTNTGVTQQSKDAGLDTWKTVHYDTPKGGSFESFKGYPEGISPEQVKDAGGNTGGNGGTGGSGGAMSDSEFQMLTKMDRNPIQEERYRQLLAEQNGGIDTRAIDEAYAGAMNEFGKQEGVVRSGAESSKVSTEDQYKIDADKANAELDKMLGDIGVNKNEFLASVADAINQNLTGYNALEQRANVRYGGGSSLGDLMRELAAKELYKQQGQARNQQVAGEAKFAGLEAEAQQFISQKLTDLGQWKKDSLAKIEQNLQEQLANISMRKQDTEIQKANAKLGLLQEAKNKAQEVSMADAQIRTEIASAYIANLQETSGKTMTPEQIQSIYSQFSDINFSPYGQATGQSTQLAYNPSTTLSKEDEDKLSQLFTAQV
jgi:hypothetical protein